MTQGLQAFSEQMAELAAGAAPSILRVDARRRLPASGIAWSDELIITAHHVVEFDADISVAGADGQERAAELVGRDPRNDLALLRVDGGLQPANWAAEDALRVGNVALVVARPGMYRASAGIVSGILRADDARQRRRRMRAAFQQMGRGKGRNRRRGKWQRRMREWGGIGLAEGLLRLDLIMYPGFSGGGAIGADGSVHGMATSGFGGGAAIALPLSALRRSVTALLADGAVHSGYIGIGVQAAQLPQAVAEALGQETGLLIVSVEAGSPAAAAGMLVGDILLALDDRALEDVDELQLALATLPVGSAVATAYARGGVLQEGSVVIGAR